MTKPVYHLEIVEGKHYAVIDSGEPHTLADMDRLTGIGYAWECPSPEVAELVAKAANDVYRWCDMALDIIMDGE